MEEIEAKAFKKKEEFQITKGIDLIKKVEREPEPKMLWKGIPEGSVGLIAGKGKTGKTTFAENLAISLSVGRNNFFGSALDGKARKVLFINLEESYKLRGRRNLKQIQVLNEKEIELFSKNYLSTPTNFPEYIDSEEDWELLQKYILESEAEIVFLDSLTHICMGEIEKSAVAQSFTKKFREYISSLGKTVIVVHHNVKGNEKPIDQDSIAGSRVITQEFEYAYGFSEIPTAEGGHYCSILFNKHIECDTTTATLYKMNSTGWIDFVGTENKFDLYKPSNSNRDRRKDSTNKDRIFEYIQSQSGQDSQPISTSNLKTEFVENSTMSKDTLHKQLGYLEDEDKIVKPERGVYSLKKEDEAKLQ